MKKLLVVLAILAFSGIAFGAGIPMVVDPANSPEVWTQDVYTATNLVVGQAVVWDFANATTPAGYTNRIPRVTLSATVNDIRIAGVCLNSAVTAGNVAVIAIRGPVYVRTAMSGLPTTASNCVGNATGITTNDTMGSCGRYTAANNSGILGWAVTTTDNTVANGGYGTTAGRDSTMTVIYVQPGLN